LIGNHSGYAVLIPILRRVLGSFRRRFFLTGELADVRDPEILARLNR
jgi:hypothetical protein